MITNDTTVSTFVKTYILFVGKKEEVLR